jgi:hypothetical protein
MLLEPFFIKIDETQMEEIQYISADKKQEDYCATLTRYAQLLRIELVTVDPNLLSASDVEKMNDYSVLNDWFDEKFDSDKEKALILNTDDIDKVISKYGTRYVLKTGIATVTTRSGGKRTFFYGFLFDIKTNELLYRKYEYFKTKDRQDLVNTKTYQMLFELMHPTKK